MEITQLNIDDLNKYIELRSQLGGHIGNMSISDYEKKYESIKEQNSFIYVIKIGSHLIATGKLLIELKFFDSVGHIEDIVVDSVSRGLGCGKIIVQHLLDEAEKMGCYKCVLDAKDELIPFYTKCGLENTGVNFVKRFK